LDRQKKAIMTRFRLILVLPLITACLPSQPDTRHSPLTSWRFLAIDGKTPVADQTELSIYPRRFTAHVGCNRMGGELHVEPGRLKFGMMTATQMYCEQLMDQEQAVAALLSASPSFFIEGDRMIMRSGAHSAELIKRATD
jgi:heat shock protein HslJ